MGTGRRKGKDLVVISPPDKRKRQADDALKRK
jgi:hypothetical protein